MHGEVAHYRRCCLAPPRHRVAAPHRKLGLGKLPGDIPIERDGFNFYFPITTRIIISLILTLILWIFRR